MTASTRIWDGMSIPAPGSYELDAAHKRIGFVARHMMVSPVRGEFREANAHILVAEDPLESSIAVTIRADSLDTANADRDTHLRSADFLDVEQFPTLEYRSTGIALLEKTDPIFFWAKLKNHRLGRRAVSTEPTPEASPVTARFVLTGELTVKGVTRTVDLQVEFGGARRDPYGQDIFGFSATAEIDREDYGLVWNVALDSGGVLVGKNVRIEIAGEAIRQG
ncbi:YceI family protein [Micromonospora sp. NPDC051296]|uniref:YceI family protein n=1 Tax=Micromonospora sp. NPDC051296 TaxID=3155046 RepID=UPI003446A5BA